MSDSGPRIHDEVRLIREVAGVPAGAKGTVVTVYGSGLGYCVELDDPGLVRWPEDPENAGFPDGTIDVRDGDVEVVRRSERAAGRSAA